MPLESLLGKTKERCTKKDEYQSQSREKPESQDPDDPTKFPEGLEDLLDDDGFVPAGSLLRRETVLKETYTPPPEKVGIDTNKDCVVYRVRFECKRVIRLLLVDGVHEYLVREEEAGHYQLYRFIQECANGSIEVTPWSELNLLGDDDQSLQLIRQEEKNDGHNPPPTTGDLTGGTGATGLPDVWLWRPPEVWSRAIGHHGYTERYDEGKHHVLRETIWLFVPPVVVKGCWVVATYYSAVRTTKWLIGGPDRPIGEPEVKIEEPALTMTKSWLIPGCEVQESD